MSPVFQGLPVQVSPMCNAWTDERVTPEMQERIETMAVSWLWHLSGEQFGTETITVRPVAPWPAKSTVIPTWPGAHRTNQAMSQSPSWWWLFQRFGSGVHDYRMVVDLPAPVIEIHEVMQDGQPVDKDHYTLYGSRFLVRTDGRIWHLWQNLARDIEQRSTLAVKLTRGKPWPAWAEIAAGEVCCEMAKGLLGDQSCKLSDRAKTITRQGVTIELPTIAEFQTVGLTGITEVDRWIQAVNPNHLQRSAKAWSPDLMQNWRV